jgi:hypothetical protein
LRDGRQLVLNEDGKYLHLPVNDRITEMLSGHLLAGDFIVGNAILCAPGELEAVDAEDEEEEDWH